MQWELLFPVVTQKSSTLAWESYECLLEAVQGSDSKTILIAIQVSRWAYNDAGGNKNPFAKQIDCMVEGDNK